MRSVPLVLLEPVMPATAARIPRGRAASMLGAALFALVVAVQPVAAVSWTGEARISSASVFRPTTLRTGASRAVVVWQHGSYAYLKRTTDGGVTWLPRVTLASGIGVGVSASASGSSVDVVYTKRATCASTGDPVWRLWYRRSLNGGATWSTPKALIGACSSAADHAIARHANGQVSVAWTGYSSGRILVRTSIDGGATFRAAVQAAGTTDWEPGNQPFYRGTPAIAIGTKGTTYIAYSSAVNRLSVRRSSDRGATWSSATTLTASAAGPEIDLLATDGRAVVGYMRSVSGQMQAVYRRTVDRGATWSTTRQTVALQAGQFSLWPRFAYRSGVLVMETKAGVAGDSPVWYRTSSDFGLTWSARHRVSVERVEDSDPEPGGIALLDGTVLATYTENRGTGSEGMWVRRGTP